MTHVHSRLIWLDLLRAMAILAMVVFHFTFDLMYFGYIKAGTVFQPEWRMFERSIAISFLFLAGLSWQHTHRAGIKWRTVWRRVALLGTAAVGISIVTYFTFGPYMICFGILHLILAMSLLSLPLLSLHWAVPLACTAALGSYFIWADGPVQGSVWWMWIIWTSETTGSVDYRPIMPWGFAFFSGMAAHALFTRLNAFTYYGPSWGWARPFAFAGRHSLPIYLIHQPILFAGFNIYGFFVV
jgi:uncharacterized membrane protein